MTKKLSKKKGTPKGKRRKEASDEPLKAAHIILASDELRPSDDLRRWAELVVERHAAGRSIANAKDWLDSVMVGMDTEYLE
jgi:hypothetical protein